MTTTTTSPDKQLAELSGEQARIRRDRTELEGAIAELRRGIEQIPARRRDVLVAEMRGQELPESIEQIESDEHQAAGEIAAKSERIEAAREVEQQFDVEMQQLADANAGWFIERAEAASERAGEAADEAAEAIRAADAASRAAIAAWGLPRQTALRRGHPLPNDVGPPDYLAVKLPLRMLLEGDPFWPGSRRRLYEAWRAEHGGALVDPDAN